VGEVAHEIEVHARVEPVAAEWKALAERVGAPPWLRPGWVAAWLETHGEGPVELTVVRRDGLLAGLVALHRPDAGGAAIPVWQSAIAEDEDAARALAVALCSRRRRLTLLHGFPGLASAEPFGAAGAEAGYRAVVADYLRSPYVDLAGSWDQYRQTRSRKYLKEVDRRRRRLAEQSEVTFELLHGDERLEELLEEGFLLEGSGWKVRAGTAIVSRPESRAYYTALARWAASEGMLRLAFLRVGDRPIGFDFLLEDERRMYNLKGGYDEEYAKFGPGTLVVHDCLAYAFEAGLETYELLGDVEPWKLEWAHGVRERTKVSAFPPGPAGNLGYVALAHARPAARRVRSLLRR
jgi:CelD/BcsL family acetyltransferase involved in cellulose biosynthesis